MLTASCCKDHDTCSIEHRTGESADLHSCACFESVNRHRESHIRIHYQRHTHLRSTTYYRRR